MYRFLVRVVFVALSLLFLSALGCTPSQKPISDDQGVVYFMNQVEDSAREGRWQEAEDSVAKLEAAWARDRNRLNTPKTRDNINKFEVSLQELRDEIADRDKEDVNEEIERMRDYYRNITGP